MGVSQKKVSPQCRSVDPTEENDADDEGEIWYNPIPEDDVPDISHRPSVRVLLPQDPHRKLSRGRDAVQVGRTLEGPSGSGQEVRVEGLGSSSGDVSQGNAAHSTQAPHPHRQMPVCKPQEEGGASASRLTGKGQQTTFILPVFVDSCLLCLSEMRIYVLLLWFCDHQ